MRIFQGSSWKDLNKTRWVTLQWTSICSRGISGNIPCHFVRINSSLIGDLVCMLTLPLPYHSEAEQLLWRGFFFPDNVHRWTIKNDHRNNYVQQQYLIYLLLSFFLTKEQDQGLEALSGIIQRQKLMGQAISDEVDAHNGQYSFKTSVWLQSSMHEDWITRRLWSFGSFFCGGRNTREPRENPLMQRQEQAANSTQL